MNWEHIRYFVAVVRAGTVVGAARHLGVSHATVLRNVARLEDDLGIRLFDHVRSGYRVTAEGEEIFADALVMEERAEALTRRAMGRDPAPAGSLQLIVPDDSLVPFMPSLRAFRAEFPRIDLTLGTAGESAARSIDRREADVAIVVTNSPPEDLVGRQLSRINFAAYASLDYRGERAAPLVPDECHWVMWDPDGAASGIPVEGTDRRSKAGLGYHGWQQQALRRITARPNIALRVTSHADALAAVRSGVGVGFLSDRFRDELSVLPFNVAIDPVGVWILTHPDLRRSGRVQAFMEFIAGRYLSR